ncbi:MAG: T9SS type A sorting domain-containing protein [Bacteroidota bacterium]
MKRLFSFSILLLLLSGMVSSQEVITGLQVNSQVKKKALQEKSVRNSAAPLLLPFFDDFFSASVFPDPDLWSDNDAFISNDYAVNPPTVGVATLDAINSLGRLHENASEFPFKADFLTSLTIRLDSVFSPVPRKINRADSVYFSFYYQPQGFGNVPAHADSLVLEFLAPGETQTLIFPVDTVINGIDTIVNDTVVIEGWRKAWSSPGLSLDDFFEDDSTWFRQVIIPVNDSVRFYSSEFRFRFRNYASLSSSILPDWQSNGDQWNIDYVYLNTGRGYNDTLHRDVAFAGQAPRMLRNYTSMPYNQYRSNFIEEMRDSLELKITNLDGVAYNASYRYEVARDYQQPFKEYNGGNYYVAPFTESGYVEHPPFATPPVNFQFPIGDQERVYFTTTHILNTEASLSRRENDTIRNVQLFANYLSYDDGTAEAGYGLSSASAQLAYRFKLNRPDSLLAFQMYFNQTLKDGNINDFYLNVWNDYFGEPGDLIYSKYGYEPAFEDSLNQFFTYKPDSVIQIEPGKFPNLTFYIGWEQVTADNLNIGFDRNNDASSNTFFRNFGGWNNSLYSGALMIRPILGKEKVVGIPGNKNPSALGIYPNPTSDGKIIIKLPEGGNQSFMRTAVYNSTGMCMIDKSFSREEDFGHLNSGIYFIQVTGHDGTISGRARLVINR